jgi:hypothetical protein
MGINPSRYFKYFFFQNEPAFSRLNIYKWHFKFQVVLLVLCGLCSALDAMTISTPERRGPNNNVNVYATIGIHYVIHRFLTGGPCTPKGSV